MKHAISIFLAACLLSQASEAATYYVSKTGNDSNPGTAGSRWLTIGKANATMVAGDKVIVGDGDYDEQIQESTAGTAGNYITYEAENRGMASMRAFRFSAAYVKVDGFVINRYSGVGNTWNGAVRVDTGATGFILTNCTIKDAPYVLAHDFSFNSANQSVNSASSNFINAGFVQGSKVYLGASGWKAGDTPLYYVNHDQTWTVASVSANSMTLTAGSATFQPDAGAGYWGFIRAGTQNGGFAAVECVVTGGVGPTGGQVTNCTVQNWCGHALRIRGDGHTVENNTMTGLLSFRAIEFQGSNHVFRRNKVFHCPNVIHYSAYELANIKHPAGTGWYDYQVGMVSGFVTGITNHQNVLFEENWFEDVENQMGRVDDELAGAYDITFRRNVFVGVSEHFSGGRDGMKWLSNTFYRCAFGTAGHPLTVGGRPPAQSNYEISGNIFVACGKTGVTESQSRGFYSIDANATAPVTANNFVAGEELLGFAGKTAFTEPTGINGGDPVFYNANDPDGADNMIFTADDGLKVLANSPAAGIGGGALGVRPVTSGQPVAHFRVSAPIGWWEGTGENYNPNWLAQLPTVRGAPVRAYDTPPSFVGVPTAVTFDASKSLSGVGGASTNTAITNYSWAWGDGTPVTTTTSPTVSHTFTAAGDKTVTLTVTNSAGATATFSNTYRFPGAAKRVPQDYATVQAAVDAAQPGDTILVGAGTYNEAVRTKTSGTANNRITIEGEAGAIVRQFYFQNPYWTVRRLKFEGAVTAFGRYVWIRRGAHFSRLEQCILNCGLIDDVRGIEWENPSTGPFNADAASDCVITGNEVLNTMGTFVVNIHGARNLIEGNLLKDGMQVDWFQIWGENNIIRGNTCRNNYKSPTPMGWHADFVQTHGLNGHGSRGHIIEGNVIDFIEDGGLTQLEGNLLPEIGDWTFRNNIFIRVGNSASCTIPNVRHLNNVYYQCQKNNGGHVLSFGGRQYTINGVTGVNFAHGATVKNCIFLDCGDGSATKGWYDVKTTYGPLTGTEFDGNYVASAGYVAKRPGVAAYPNAGFDANKFWEPHGVNGVNPLFWDESVFDFRLRTGSPLIDTGVTVAQVTNDFVGVSRPLGAGYDIGAYEFVDDGGQPPPPPVDNPTPPNAPSALAALAIGASTIAISWTDESNNELAFEIQRSPDGTSWVQVGQTGANATSWADTGLASVSTYYYRLRATNAAGLSAWSNVTVATTADIPPQIRRFPRGSKAGGGSL